MLAVEMLTEPVVLDDVYVSGLAHIEDIGDGNYRLLFYKKQHSLHGGEEHILVCRMVATPQAMIQGVKTVMAALGKRCCGAVSGFAH